MLASNAISLEDLHAQIQLAMHHIQHIQSESAQFINDIQTKTNAVQQTLQFLSHQIGASSICDKAAAAGNITTDDHSEHTAASTEVATEIIYVQLQILSYHHNMMSDLPHPFHSLFLLMASMKRAWIPARGARLLKS